METHTLIDETDTSEQLAIPQKQQPEKIENGNKGTLDAKQRRTEHIGALLGAAYMGASTVKLKDHEWKKLREDFPDTAIEIRPHDGLIYLNHILLRERLWDVLGPGVAEICRERFFKNETSEVAVDLVLMVRGSFVAEAIGMSKYYPQNPKTSFGDVVESAWSDALRRCCKHWGIGSQCWRPAYVRDWVENNAVQQGGKWYRKDDPRVEPGPGATKRKPRDYTLKDDKPTSEFQKMKAAVQAVPEVDEEGVPF
jgi:hypothetical protein